MIQKLWANRFLRFLVVGFFNTVFGYSIFALFIFVGYNYIVAAMLGTIGGILFNFKSVGVIVFKSHNNALIFRFFAVYGVVYLFNLTGIKIFADYGIGSYIAGAILVLPAAAIGYLLNKKFVFNRTPIDIKEDEHISA
ncbi:GtrA family protein [Candidatus Microgenomates bacterium]|nr:GtrA family protein [Candidatus Microgenomates bacterium]